MSTPKQRADRAAYKRQWYLKRKHDPAGEALRERVRLYKEQHPEKIKAAGRARYARQRDRAQIRSLETKWRRIGIVLTYAGYERMVAAQKGRCAICDQPERGKRLAVDHCHTTKSIRGLLCAKCNRGIGLFGDDPERMVSASDYVRRSRLRLIS